MLALRSSAAVAGFVTLVACVPGSRPRTTLSSPDEGRFGAWTRDDAGLPAFDADLERHPVPWYPFTHLIGTGRLSALLDQWGNVRLLTTEGGTTALTPVTGRTRGGLYAVVETTRGRTSLVFGELRGRKTLRWGTGYGRWAGDADADGVALHVEQQTSAAPDRDSAIDGELVITNRGSGAFVGTIAVQTDVFVRPGPPLVEAVAAAKPEAGAGFARFVDAAPAGAGDVFLVGPADWKGEVREHRLRLARDVQLAPGERTTVRVRVGYGARRAPDDVARELSAHEPAAIRAAWARRLERVSRLGAPDPWMRDEAIWSFGQLLSFESWDATVAEHYVHLGGYAFFPRPDDPAHVSFPVREDPELVLPLALFDPELARRALRWTAALQRSTGDIPKNHNMTRDRDFAHMHVDSDTELWFLLATAEYVRATGDWAALDAPVRDWDGETLSLWQRVRRAHGWIANGIGVGRHGLVLMKDGDWNDYLSRVGRQGRGESLMNTALACRAYDGVAELARHRGEGAFADVLAGQAARLRAAGASAFDREWFVAGYGDDGSPIAGRDDRLYLNAQAWAALARIGTVDQRRSALRAALRENGTRIGLMLLSRAYPSPPPEDLSYAPLPAGQGENGGIWPQTVYWMVWALAEEGLVDEAIAEWKKMSLRNHAREFPDAPFGIYNGPDCYASKLAGDAEGWTQTDVFNRLGAMPQNPIVGWQAFALAKIEAARARR